MPTGPRPSTPNVAEVTMEFTENAQYLYNTHHFFDDAGWDEGRLNNLGTAIREWWDDNVKGYVSNTVALTQIKCRDLSEPNGLETAVTVGLPTFGTSEDKALPNSVTIAVGKKTGHSGRSYQGRTYHIGMVQSQANANTITPAFQTILRNAYTELMTPAGGLFDPQLCVLSEVQGGAWRGTGIATVVTGISVDATIDNQRRRLPGRGR